MLDDLSSGVADRLGDVPLVVADVADGATVARTLREHGVRGVVHLAAKKQVEESVRQPLRYYRENVEGLRALLEAVTAAGVDSSSSPPAPPSTARRTSIWSTRRPRACR